MRRLSVAVAGLIMAGTGMSADVGADVGAGPATGPASGPASGPATSRPVKDISAAVGEVLKKHSGLPGMGGAVVEVDGVSAVGVAGVRKTGSSGKILAGDLFHLGSNTKSMTAVLIGQLVEENKLGFETTMGEIFPAWAKEMNPEMAKVTVRDLLEQRSGITGNLDWWAYSKGAGPMMEKRVAVAKALLGKAPASPVGSKYEYSNSNFVLLGAIVEAKAGAAWEDVIKRKLFGPLKMGTAGVGPVPKVGEPWGHVRKGEVLEAIQGDNGPVMAPAGEVYCSLSDYGKYLGFCLEAGQRDTALLKQATFREMTTPRKGGIYQGGNYAGGWIVVRPWASGRAVLSHDGSNTQWYVSTWLFEGQGGQGFGVVGASNDGEQEASKACHELTDALAAKRAGAAGH